MDSKKDATATSAAIEQLQMQQEWSEQNAAQIDSKLDFLRNENENRILRENDLESQIKAIGPQMETKLSAIGDKVRTESQERQSETLRTQSIIQNQMDSLRQHQISPLEGKIGDLYAEFQSFKQSQLAINLEVKAKTNDYEANLKTLIDLCKNQHHDHLVALDVRVADLDQLQM
jgi:chromosome segregation ATPase